MLDPELGNYVRRVLSSGDVLTTIERLLLIALALYADGEGRGAFPANATLAKHIGCHPRTARDILRKLEARGIISSGGTHKQLATNIYDLRTDFSTTDQRTRSPSPGREQDRAAPTAAARATLPSDAGGHIVPPPPGVRPSEYQYQYVYKRTRDPYKRVEEDNNRNGDSEGARPSERRRKINEGSLQREIEALAVRFSYFLADSLIARGRKKQAFRDDAQTPEWLEGMRRVTFAAFGLWAPVGLLDLEEALEYHLDSEDGAHARKPQHLSVQKLRKIIDMGLCGSSQR